MRLTWVGNAWAHQRCDTISDNACQSSLPYPHPLDLDGWRGPACGGLRLRNRRGCVLWTPADAGCDLAGDGLEHRDVVVDPKLARDGQEDRVGSLHGGVTGELFRYSVGLARIAATKTGD